MAELNTTLGGNAVLLAAAAWLIKTLVSNRFALDAEKFRIELKASVDTEIERLKALLTRATRVHERQVDTLTRLYRHFFEAQAYLQRMAASARFEGEVSSDEYRRLCANAIASSRDTLLDGRLLIPPDLSQLCDQFFDSLFQGQTELAFADHPMVVDGLQRGEFWGGGQENGLRKASRYPAPHREGRARSHHGELPAAGNSSKPDIG